MFHTIFAFQANKVPLDGVVVEDVAAVVEVVKEAIVVEALALVEGVVVVNLHNN